MDETSETKCSFSTKVRLPDDTVFFGIFPDAYLPSSCSSQTLNHGESLDNLSFLHSLHLQIQKMVSPYTYDYIWQHEPFNLSPSSNSHPSCFCSTDIPHLHGKVRFGDNLEDEWFIVFLLFEISRALPSISIRVWDNDGEFLLIETAFHLPQWVNPDNSINRVFIGSGDLLIVPEFRISNPSLADSLAFLATSWEEARASASVQSAVKNRISEYPERARRNVHRCRVRVPLSVAQVLVHEPCLVSLAVEGFYDRDIDTMKHAARMDRFLKGGRREELVQVCVKMSRAMYAQLVQQTFQAPKCYPVLPKENASALMEADLGMKLACGFEMMYQQKVLEGFEGKGSAWDKFRESLEKSGYFEGLLHGSEKYRRLMKSAEKYYKSSSLFSRASEMMSAPVRRIDEILALPFSSDDFRVHDLPPSDNDSWLYDGEEDLCSALQQRQKEMELYNSKRKGKNKFNEHEEPCSVDLDDLVFDDIAKSMQAFVDKMSSYEGVELPESRDFKTVDFDVDSFMKELESVNTHLGVNTHPGAEGPSVVLDGDEDCSSEIDFDYSEDGSNIGENEDIGGDYFMHSYSDALNEQLKSTTLRKSFVHADGQPIENAEGTSEAPGDNMDEEFRAVDVDVNLVKSLMESFSCQQGLSGPASNLLGLMGLQLPQDTQRKGN